MAQQKNTITINGKVYDTATGKVIRSTPAAISVDAIVKPKSSVQTKQIAHTPHSVIPAQNVHHKTSKSHTLMRHVVQKPTEPVARPSNAKSSLESKKSSPRTVAISKLPVSQARLARASQSHQSKLVSHFGSGHSHIVVKKQAAVQVQRAPQTKTTTVPSHSTNTHQAYHSDKDLLIDAAMLRAISHEQPKTHLTKRRHKVAHKLGLSPRFVSITAAIVTLLFIGGFYTYQQMPAMAMKIAASKAGVAAKLPGFHPNGYALDGAVTYAPGQVTFDFRARDNRSYRVTQTQSELNSQALASVLGASTNESSSTYQVAGRTVYISDNTATWVDNGIWFKVEGRSALSTDQLLKIAASL